MGSREPKPYCALDEATLEMLKFAMADLNFSACMREVATDLIVAHRPFREREPVRECGKTDSDGWRLPGQAGAGTH